MAEQPKQEKKSVWFKLQEAVPDREEQFEFVSLLVRLILLGWATAMLSLSYLDLSKLGIPQQKIDPTFIASVFTGVLASFGIQTASKKGDGTMKMNGNGVGQVSKADMEKLIERASQTAPAQTIRIEQAPLVLSPPPQKPPTA